MEGLSEEEFHKVVDLYNIHIGMPDHETALRVYNNLTGHCLKLCRMGDGSHGRRLSIYQKVASKPEPPVYKDWPEFFDVARIQGFDKNPRNCWTLIRISVHGTIEFRMFGSTESLEQISYWARECHALCKDSI